MKILINKKRFKVYVWIGVAWLLLMLLTDALHKPESFRVFINHIWLTGYLVFIHYILFERTLPSIRLSWKRVLVTPVLLMAHVLLYTFGTYIWRGIGIGLHIYKPFRVFESIEKALELQFEYSLGSMFFFGIVKYSYDFRKLKEAAQLLRIEKQAAELNYLKSQTNPHFLFNTLNNIYSLARDKSDLAPESILRLSKILRFMLYEAGGEYISIEEELKVISDYIDLEKLRYDESLRINFNYDAEDMKQAIPPLLLIPLVENAFKHGVSESRHKPFVDIHLSVKKRQLLFMVKNSHDEYDGQGNVKENIGLSNLRRQLALLYTDYDLSVKQGEGIFTATLKINLGSHV